MGLETIKLRRSQPLAEDYIALDPKLNRLFAYHFKDKDAWFRRAEELKEASRNALGPDKRLQADRAALVSALIAYNRRIGNSNEALGAVESLLQPDALVVVGGQQAGLFGGPLYNIYKAVTIIQTAREAAERLNRPVIPVFWIAGEDHDWDEVNHIHYLSNHSDVRKLKIEPNLPLARTSISRFVLDPEIWQRTLEQLEESLVDSEYKRMLMAKLDEITGCSTTLTEVYARLMAWLFGSHGLVFIDSDDPGIRQVESSMFQALIEHNELVNDALLQGDALVRELGYQPQAEVHKDGANLFIFDQEERVLLMRDGDEFADKKGHRTYTKQQLIELAGREPHQFSNNVLTRPLMQEFLFPVLATVLGHGEIAYWGLTRQAFEAMGMQMPILVPRLEFTLLNEGVRKHMAHYGLTFDDIFKQFEAWRAQWLEQQDQVPYRERFAKIRTMITDEYNALTPLLNQINRGLETIGQTNLSKIMEQIDYYEKKTSEAQEFRHQTDLQRLDRIANGIYPFNQLQERVYNVIAYINQYGKQWLDDLIALQIPIDGEHRIYDL